MSIVLTKGDAEKILSGSLFLGCGGGGDDTVGKSIIEKAVPKGVELVSLDEVPQEGLFLTISPVGSPASTESHCDDDTYERIITLFKQKQKEDPRVPQGEVVGLLPCEIGALSSFCPMMTASLCGIPVVDAACDGRAHPFGSMGSLGLEKRGGVVVQVCAGGKREKNYYVEVSVIASVDAAANIIRTSAANAGGMVAVARNPIDYAWMKKTAAPGAYSFARRIGESFAQEGSAAQKLQAVCGTIGGQIVAEGVVGDILIETKNALDYGRFTITTDAGEVYAMTFCNEYMSMDGPDGERKFTFPDFMATCTAEDGKPVSTAKLKKGDRVFLLGSSRHNMLLGQGLRYRAPYLRLEDALGIEMLRYVGDIIDD